MATTYLAAPVEHGKGGVLAATAHRGAGVPHGKVQPHVWEVPPHRCQRLRCTRFLSLSGPARTGAKATQCQVTTAADSMAADAVLGTFKTHVARC